MRRGGGGALAAAALAATTLAAGAAPGCNQLAGADEFYVDAPAAPPPAPGGPCATNAECTERAAGEPSLCRKADQVCVRVASDECAYFVGNALADDAVIVGAIGPTTGVDVLLGQGTQNALSLALQDFAAAGGLPPAAPGGPRRQLALVGCDEAKDPIAAARHLAYDLGVPAIVGASASGLTTQIADEVTVAAKALLISPSATSASLTDLADGGLVWRTAPSDVQQSAALARLAADFAADVRASIEFATVAVLYKEDSYGKGLFDDISARLKPAEGRGLLGPNDRLFGFSYGNPDDLSVTPDPAASYDLAVDQLVAEAPQLVLALGTTEVVTELMRRVESRLPPLERPRYLFPDGGYVPQLSEFVAADESLRARVRGTRPLLAGPTFDAFRDRYAGSFRDGTAADSVGAAAAYDAFYLVAFAIAALGPGEAVDGPAIARGLGRLVPPGAPFRFEPESIDAAFDALARGGNVDVDGASGPLDFDLTSGEAPAGTLVWCPAPFRAGVGALPAPSGLSFEPVRGLIIGTLSPDCPDVRFSPPPPPPPTRAP